MNELIWGMILLIIGLIITTIGGFKANDGWNKLRNKGKKEQFNSTEQTFIDHSTHIGRDQINYYYEDKGSDNEERIQYGTIQFLELLKMFIIPQGESYNVQDWRIGAKSSSPITWISDGIDWVDNDNKDIFCNYSNNPAYRQGKVYIQLGENYTHYILNKDLVPVVWDIYLMGARSGIFEIALVNNVCTERIKFQQYFKELNCLKSEIIKGLHPMQIKSEDLLFGLYSETYTIIINGVNVTINELIDESGNCGSQVEILFSPTGDNVLKNIFKE